MVAALPTDSFEPVARSSESLRLIHHHAGYVRVQSDAFARPDDTAALAAARAAAEAVPGVRSWKHNSTTGSAVITYDPQTVEADDLIKHIAKAAGLQGVEVSTRHRMTRTEVVNAFMDTVQDVNGLVRKLAADRADLRELVPVALAVTSVVSFLLNEDRGRLPQWANAAYHSYRVFMHWHRPEIRERERIARQEEAARDNSDADGGNAR